MNKPNQWIWTTKIAFFLSILGFILLIVFSCAESFNDWNWVLKPELADNYGSLVSGVVGSLFSLAGIFLLYETIIKQQNLFNLQQFESKLFELVRYHRENVQTITDYRIPSEDNELVSSSAYFVEITEQYERLFKRVKEILPNEYSEKDVIGISLLVLYYGVSNRTKSTLKESLRKHKEEDIENLIKELRKEKTKYDSEVVFYGGHQHRLGHYLRHLSQIVKFVDKSNFLTDEQKYDYVKLLRAQMTQFELKFFFYNSLARYGRSWEEKYGYITKYKLLKNLPEELGNGIKPKNYYNKFKYDWES